MSNLPFHVPGYYSPASQPPPRPGWYLCYTGGGIGYLNWRCGSFWDGLEEREVSYWVEVPGFVARVLESGRKTP